MLNGIAPILIFRFKTVSIPFTDFSFGQSKVPVVAKNDITIPLIPIPIYLDERLTGIYIESESKNIDIQTNVDGLPDKTGTQVTQKPLNSVVTINALANKDSIGLNILLAMNDLIFQKVRSQEYAVDYINGAMTLFGGLLEGFTVSQDSNTTLYNISLHLSNAPSGSTVEKKEVSQAVEIKKSTGAVPLG